MADPISDNALVSLTRFAIHLLARQEVLEAILLQKNIVAKEELLLAFDQAEASIGMTKQLHYRDEKSFEHELAEHLKTLQLRLRVRLR